MTTHTEPTMVELARVLNEAQGVANTPNNIEVAKEEVKAVLLALKQPSKGMVEAGRRHIDFHDCMEEWAEIADMQAAFTAMIDAILSEGE